MIGRFTKAATAAVLLFALLMAAQGQYVRLHRGAQGRRVGRITLPTPPFNPDAGILNGRTGRERSSTGRRSKAAKRNAHLGKTRKKISKRR